MATKTFTILSTCLFFLTFNTNYFHYTLQPKQYKLNLGGIQLTVQVFFFLSLKTTETRPLE